MKKIKIKWGVSFKTGAQHVPGFDVKSKLYKKIHYSADKSSRYFYVECKISTLNELEKLQALTIDFNPKLFRYTVRCADEAFYVLFEQIFLEMFQFMEKEDASFEEGYNTIINKYAAFLQGMKYLPKENQIGLLAELLFLEDLLDIKKSSLKYWIDMNEDFKVRSNYVEIKATRSKEHKHIISGLNQLTVIPNTQKYLASYLVEDNDSLKTKASVNLYTQTNKLLKALPVRDKLIFLEKLIDRKYFHTINGVEYEEFNFTFYEELISEVDSAFPKLDINSVPKSKQGNIPPSGVKYDLNLQSILPRFSKLNKAYLIKNII